MKVNETKNQSRLSKKYKTKRLVFLVFFTWLIFFIITQWILFTAKVKVILYIIIQHIKNYEKSATKLKNLNENVLTVCVSDLATRRLNFGKKGDLTRKSHLRNHSPGRPKDILTSLYTQTKVLMQTTKWLQPVYYKCLRKSLKVTNFMMIQVHVRLSTSRLHLTMTETGTTNCKDSQGYSIVKFQRQSSVHNLGSSLKWVNFQKKKRET